jgi:hypothetical protein
MADGVPDVERFDEGDAKLTLEGADPQTLEVFAEFGMDASGYDWGEVAQALTLMKMPAWAKHLFFDPEGGYLLVIGPSKAVLDELAGWLRQAMTSPELLVEAIEFAEAHKLDGCSTESWKRLAEREGLR